MISAFLFRIKNIVWRSPSHPPKEEEGEELTNAIMHSIYFQRRKSDYLYKSRLFNDFIDYIIPLHFHFISQLFYFLLGVGV